MRPLGFDGRMLGVPTPRIRPVDYQYFISESAPEAAGAESCGGSWSPPAPSSSDQSTVLCRRADLHNPFVLLRVDVKLQIQL